MLCGRAPDSLCNTVALGIKNELADVNVGIAKAPKAPDRKRKPQLLQSGVLVKRALDLVEPRLSVDACTHLGILVAPKVVHHGSDEEVMRTRLNDTNVPVGHLVERRLLQFIVASKLATSLGVVLHRERGL